MPFETTPNSGQLIKHRPLDSVLATLYDTKSGNKARYSMMWIRMKKRHNHMIKLDKKGIYLLLLKGFTCYFCDIAQLTKYELQGKLHKMSAKT